MELVVLEAWAEWVAWAGWEVKAQARNFRHPALLVSLLTNSKALARARARISSSRPRTPLRHLADSVAWEVWEVWAVPGAGAGAGGAERE
ncbi:unnamed protein product, partial [marine sediment metagenome]